LDEEGKQGEEGNPYDVGIGLPWEGYMLSKQEMKLTLRPMLHDSYPFSQGIYCVYCKGKYSHGITSRQYIDCDKDYFSGTVYCKWANLLREKDCPYSMLSTGEIRWFCSIVCLVNMIDREWDYILEKTTL
jgi:hypothetical protein